MFHQETLSSSASEGREEGLQSTGGLGHPCTEGSVSRGDTKCAVTLGTWLIIRLVPSTNKASILSPGTLADSGKGTTDLDYLKVSEELDP